MAKRFRHDQWSPLAHKEALGLGDGNTPPPDSPFYLPVEDARRLAAYRILAAYRDNVARYHLPDVLWMTDMTGHLAGAELSEVGILAAAVAAAQQRPAAEKYREYGHGALLVAQARSLLLGDAQDVVLPALEELRDEDATGDESAPDAATGRLEEFDDWLQGWATDERLPLRLLEGEEHTVGSGDVVYALGWSEGLARPRLRVYEPDAYFPDLDAAGDDEEFPTTVHLAWEIARGQEVWLHRKTWRLVELETLSLPPRPMPWHESGQKPATRTCTYEVTEFNLTALDRAKATVYNLAAANGTVKIAVTDLGIDFLPVVHVPNDAPGARHFGRSVLTLAAQALDDVSATDTDLQTNSELVGSTPLVTKGAPAGLGGGPGAQWNLPDGGDAKLLDTSKALDGLIKYQKHLAGIVDVNTRLSSALLGRIAPNEVPSGYALELGFASTRSLIREMRMVRAEKYPLIPKMAMRLAQAAKVLPAGPTPEAVIVLGGYLPADKAAAMTQVTDGLRAHAISRRTGVAMLMAADFPIEDAQAETDRIRTEAYDDMVRLVEALGTDGEAQVRDWLGIAALPPVVLPDLPPVPEPPAA